MILAAKLEWAFRPDGWIHLVQQGYDLPRGPVGLLAYLPFALVFWLIPRRRRRSYLTGSSLLVSLATLGPAYAATIAALALAALAVVRGLATRRTCWLGVSILIALNAALICRPQPFWLPPVPVPLYFYLQWAGLGFLFLRSLHVLVDVATGKMPPPPPGDFLAYLLFAPTLRMGPIYRFNDFAQQLHGDHARHRDVGRAALRMLTGCIRLGLMTAVLDRFPIEPLFNQPGTLPAAELLLRVYLAPMSIYLWISGYIDLSVGVGCVMGFRVPENFNYPWRSTSIAEFWRRWHITLGAWLRDYIYIPLGGNRRHVFLNYTLTFLLCALWHGTYVSYVLWGLSQGIGLAVRRLWSRYWQARHEANGLLYQKLARARLVASPINTAAAWLLTFHYQILTINLFMDDKHSLGLLTRHLMGLLHPA